MGYYNEADTRASLIASKVKRAGWGEGQIERALEQTPSGQ
jgi:hypothetical protein